MTDVEVLKSYRYVMMEMRALDRQMDTLMELSGPRGLTTARIGRIAGTNEPEARLSQNLAACEEQLKACKRHLNQITARFEAILNSAPDQRTRTILRFYYGNGYTDEHIAYLTGLCERTISRIRSRFLARYEGTVSA